MTAQLNATQLAEIKALLATAGLKVTPIRPTLQRGKPRKPKLDQWAKRHAARMSKTERNVAKYGRFKDARGAFDYRTGINPPKVNDPKAINDYYAALAAQEAA